MDRLNFKLTFRQDKAIRYRCPHCKTGLLSIDEDYFKCRETEESLQINKEESFDPDFVTLYYSCIFVCSGCKEIVAGVGHGFVDSNGYIDEDGEPQQNYYYYFRPKYFYPPLNIIDIPDAAPASIKIELLKSFELLFCNPSSSLNHIRISLEELLNELKIKKYNIIKNKKKFISLHNRIELLKSPYDKYIQYLLAIKWLGNTGSHGGSEIIMDDVFDACEIMEHILNDIYNNPKLKIEKITKEINKNKGPKKRK